MPSIVINSANINTFALSVKWNLASRQVIFDTSASIYNGGGISAVQGISFFLEDQDGVVLTQIDFTNPANYIVPSVTQVFTLDLSNVNYAFLFQAYQISAAIKDQDNTIYTIPVFSTTICQPNSFQESGYVYGSFQVRADCVNNNITVKEFTVLVYNNLAAQSVTKSGVLSYPTGTISAINFSNTPFSNNVVYTGQYRINNTTVATYSLPNDIYVLVNYVTNQQFDVTCSNQVSDLLCCISELYQTKVKNCDNAIGKRAAQQLEEIELPFFLGIGQEINGQDSEWAYLFIKKTLACNCGNSALGQNEVTPINPSGTNIVLVPGGGVTIPSPTVVGNTKTYTISSTIYQVTKGVPGDTSFTITTDSASTSGTTKYVIAFNYANLAAAIFTATADSPTLVAQLNSLVSATSNIDLSNLNGKCVIDLSSSNYFLSYIVPGGSTIVTNIVIGATTYAAPGGLIVSNITGIETWLNGLGLGTFEVDYTPGMNGAYFNVLTNSNTNSPVSMTLTPPAGAVVVPFQVTNKSLIAFLQAFIDAFCGITALNVALGSNLTLCTFDYNGNIVPQILSATSNTQNDFNTGAANAICNLANRIDTLTGINCTKIKALFPLSITASINVATDTYMGVLGGACTSITPYQQAMGFISAINAFSDVKAAFCAINCATPGTCPNITAINLAVVSGNIGIYGVTFSATPSANQIVTVQYRIHGTTTYATSTNSLSIFPNGNINGTTPYQINSLSTGTTYDVFITNNCGGSGFVTQITTPSATVYSGNFRIDTVLANICGDAGTTLYSSAPFATGVVMYTNSSLTTRATGFAYIAPNTGEIFNIDSTSATVGADTGSNCTNGTAGTYILGNSTSSICSGSTVTRYTSGSFTVGGTLYMDSGLTTPVSGDAYVVQVSTNIIFNLNASTGVIGSSTGLSCSATTVDITTDLVGTQISSVTGISGFTPSPSFPLSVGGTITGTHSAFTGGISVTFTGSPAFAGNVGLEVNGIPVQCINVTTAGTYTFSSRSYLSTDTINIGGAGGSC